MKILKKIATILSMVMILIMYAQLTGLINLNLLNSPFWQIGFFSAICFWIYGDAISNRREHKMRMNISAVSLHLHKTRYELERKTWGYTSLNKWEAYHNNPCLRDIDTQLLNTTREQINEIKLIEDMLEIANGEKISVLTTITELSLKYRSDLYKNVIELINSKIHFLQALNFLSKDNNNEREVAIRELKSLSDLITNTLNKL